MAQSIICERAFEFAVRTVRLCNELSRRGPTARHIASQLMKCGTSIGANAEEAQEGQTKPDYIAKMSVSRKESRRRRSAGLRIAIRVEWVVDLPTGIRRELERRWERRAMIVGAIRTASGFTIARCGLGSSALGSLSPLVLPRFVIAQRHTRAKSQRHKHEVWQPRTYANAAHHRQ